VCGRSTRSLGIISNVKAIAASIAIVTAISAFAQTTTATIRSNMISMVQLLATPEKFHGRTVQVTGFCNFEFEGNAIYLHSEDYSNSNLKNALWVDLPNPPPKFSKGPCLVLGQFDATQHGHMAMFSGLVKASRIDPWVTREK